MQTDPIIKSKRIGAIVAIVVPILARYTGIDIDEELQSNIMTVIDLLSGAVAASLLTWSKISEAKKIKDSNCG